MNINNIRNPSIIFVVLVLWVGTSISADEVSVLDATQHPDSPAGEKIFPTEILPLDVKLSWTERFNGDETFNPKQRLDTGMPMTMQQKHSTMSMDAKLESESGMDGIGVVKSVREEQGKVRISHGPIEKFGMPEMTMMFKVVDQTMLSDMKKGQKIGFNVDNTSGGFVITSVVAMDGTGGTSMDARGVVKSVRPTHGKVRIEHEPIEKYGMPAMTMVFKVKNPEILSGLEKGLKVEFDVDNSSGGFEITDIKPVN